MTWILGDLLDKVGAIVNDDAPATIHDNRISTWPEFTKASNNLARAFLAAGAGTDDRLTSAWRMASSTCACQFAVSI